MSEFGAYHIADNPKLYEPVRRNNYRFLAKFDNIDLLKVGENPNLDSSYIRNGQEILDFSVVSFDVPHFSQNAIEVRRGNSIVHYAGLPQWKTGSLVINDLVGADGKSVLMAWQALSYDVINDTIPNASEYKVDATVMEYTADNKLVRYWDLIGCWISELNEDGWDSNNGEKKQVTATITYDRAIPHLPDELVYRSE